MSRKRVFFPHNLKPTRKYKFWLARLFGKKVQAQEGICTLYAYRWLGIVYVVRTEINLERK